MALHDFMKKYEDMKEDLQRWIWKHCSTCNSKTQPKIEIGSGAGGYQEWIVLQCLECNNTKKIVTDWSPIVDFSLVNEIPDLIQGEYCQYLSIKKKEDHILLRCCSNMCRECFGRIPEACYSYHYTKMDEALKINDYDNAAQEAISSMELWRNEHPKEVPPLGTYRLLEIKRRVLSSAAFRKWVEDKLVELESFEDFGTAGFMAFWVAEVTEEPYFWRRTSSLFDKYAHTLSSSSNDESWFRKRKNKQKLLRAEIMSLEARSELEVDKKSELLTLAGNKWLELYNISGGPFTHRDFICYTFHLRNRAFAIPTEAPALYLKIHDFLMSKLDQLRFDREKIYYEGHARYFLGFHYLSKTNFVDDDQKVCLLENTIKVLEEAVKLHKKIRLEEKRTIASIQCVKAILCIEKFKHSENFDLIDEAIKHLDDTKKSNLPIKTAKILDALIGSFEEALSAIENPTQALLIISRATRKLNDFVRLLPELSIRDLPIPRVFEDNRYYLDVYLDTIKQNVKSFAGRQLSFNNIKTALDGFKALVERQLHQAFKITEKPNEEIGRSLIQAHLKGAFPQRMFQFREVKVSKGKSDILLIMDNEKYPFEVKIWRGKEYYKKGMEQIQYYMDYENVPYGFYIIFDPRVRDYRSDNEIIEYDSKQIYQLFIRINFNKS